MVGVNADMKSVKVVGTQWLSKCLKEGKNVDTKDFEMYPLNTADVSAKTPVTPEKTANNVVDSSPAYTMDLSPPKKLKLENYACSQSSGKIGAKRDCNALVVAELQKLLDAFRTSGDQWRAYGYEKAIRAIKTYGSDITSYEEAAAIPGVGSKMATKICEILTSGQLRKVDEICGNEKNRVVELFTQVWGVGPATAQGWYQQGFRTLEDLRTKANLTKQQQIGMKHFDDIQDRIPREEVEEIAAVVKKAALVIEPKLKVELCGSYRRGKETCGDVDVMITKPDNATDILTELMAQLKKSGFITDDLVNIEVNRNQKKYLGLCRLPGPNRKHRRLDIFVVPQSEYAPALMHYTGSALFNRSIRLLASRKGMSLSEHSLVAGVVRQGRDKLNDGHVVPTPTEESIFEALELEYRPAEERDH
ncbi:DNA polymerase lambda-like isoform X4 [Periplaneta americana]|uniref:DNA polymerase lambda-like isoform X4 n=1 Tax=Periplaneta americana TaxID=6978 RepID=UPI0037E781BF